MQKISKTLSSKEESNADLPLSVSRAKTFTDCKAKYRYCYIEKLPRKDWQFLIFGNFAHEILELFHQRLIDDPNQKYHHLMTQCFKDALNNWGEKLKKEDKDEGKKIMNQYLARVYDDMPNVVEVEKKFYIDIGNDVLLNGFIDRIQIDPDGMLHVADYKTTKNKKYLKNDFFQLLTYSFAIMLENPDIKKIRASYILLRHNFEYITKEFMRDDVFEIENKFLNYAENIKTEKLWRPNPQFLCKFCDFVDVCSEGKSYLIKRGIIKQKDFGLTKW